MTIAAFFRLLWGYCSFDQGSVDEPEKSDYNYYDDPNIVQWALSGDYDPSKAVCAPPQLGGLKLTLDI
jgi:hypothetical protein